MSGSTAYGAIAAHLRDAIARGEYDDGRRLPTEAELGAQHRVSRQTVRRALEELVAEGLVYRVAGRGTFTTTGPPGTHYFRSIGSIDDLLALSLDTTRETVRPLEPRADVGAAGRLQLDSDQVMVATLRRLHEGVPFGVTELVLPPAIGRRLQAQGVLATTGAVGATTVVGIVDAIAQGGIARTLQSITAVPLPEHLAPLLERPAGAPALRVDRLHLDGEGRPVELAVNHFDSHRYTYRVELRRGERPLRAAAP